MSDLIKREDVIAVIKRCKDRLQGKGLTYEIMLDMVERIPSVDRPRGEMKSIGIYYKCSVCGSEFDDEITFMGELNYCPTCGCLWEWEGADDETD